MWWNTITYINCLFVVFSNYFVFLSLSFFNYFFVSPLIYFYTVLYTCIHITVALRLYTQVHRALIDCIVRWNILSTYSWMQNIQYINNNNIVMLETDFYVEDRIHFCSFRFVSMVSNVSGECKCVLYGWAHVRMIILLEIESDFNLWLAIIIKICLRGPLIWGSRIKMDSNMLEECVVQLTMEWFRFIEWQPLHKLVENMNWSWPGSPVQRWSSTELRIHFLIVIWQTASLRVYLTEENI